MSAAGERSAIPTLHWVGDIDGHLRLIDQTRLPTELAEIECHDVNAVWEAIRHLRVRGAPAIGIAAAFGVCLGVQPVVRSNFESFFSQLDRVTAHLATSRPTAVNLFWALERMKRAAAAARCEKDSREIAKVLLDEAQRIWEEDRAMCRAIGRHGARFLHDGQGVLTHCNAGALVTVDYGTALAPIFAAQAEGKRLHIYVDETRPLLQGSRLTAWELQQRGIEATVICDSMAAQVMREGRVQAVIVGADRIASNGDTANKIGTYGVALLAAAHQIPFYVAAPSSTFDRSIQSGNQIPIEQRPAEEITHGFGRQTAPTGINVYNPAFDVTPARLIRAIICEHGVIEPVNAAIIGQVLSRNVHGVKFDFANMQTPAISIVFFLLAAFLGALGQFLYKSGAEQTSQSVTSYLLNLRLISGVACYIAVMVLFVAAFKRGGALTVLYPIYATTFIWAALIAMLAYGTEIKAINVLGMALLISGMYLMGK